MSFATDMVKSLGIPLGKQMRSAVVAGHYCLAPELTELSSEQETEESCFAYGVEIVRDTQAVGGHSRLILWINDIEIDAEQRAAIKQIYNLPENYRRILDRAGLTRADVQVLFESAMRNKASMRLRQLVNRKPQLFRKVPSDQEGLVRCIDTQFCSMDTSGSNAYVIDSPDGSPLVVKEGPNPKCNLILATLFHRVVTDHAPDVIVNVFNSIYVNRIALGVHVSRQLYDSTVPMANLFVSGSKIVDCNFAGPSPSGEPDEAKYAYA